VINNIRAPHIIREIKADVVDEACSMHWKSDKWTFNLVGKPELKRTPETYKRK
jgi:hypothetical protein